MSNARAGKVLATRLDEGLTFWSVLGIREGVMAKQLQQAEPTHVPGSHSLARPNLSPAANPDLDPDPDPDPGPSPECISNREA